MSAAASRGFAARARRGLRAAAVCAAAALLYYAGLLAFMALRVGHLPNYGSLYAAPAAYALIWRSTPAASDALRIMADEPLFEVGYKMPEFGIAEWSLLVDLPDLLQVLLCAALLFAFGELRARASAAGCPHSPAAAAAAGTSAGVFALCSASLTWVVCCAAPSWTVALSLLGVNLAAAQWLGPLDSLFAGGALALALFALLAQARLLRQRHAPGEHGAPALGPALPRPERA